ncbi:WxL protein peptidoglycan domain-containing protein [Weissella cibaria]|uniref:WxL protein peptidoglycan domain-containing protein n=1 Tax=Weissella cibaria TaxID=137591 RepID=UPI003B513D61
MMRRLLGIVVGLLMLGTVTATAHADNALTVKLTTPTAQRQESANKGYADLLTEKGATNKLTFTLQNSSDAPINVDVTPGTAGTSDNGAVVYGTQNWGENHFVNLPARMEQLITPEAKTVTVPAKGSATTSATTSVSVKTPDSGISGVLAGGVSFVQQQQTNATDSKTMFQSEVGYTVAVLNRTTNAILVPNLSIGDVNATLVNNQATVGIQMLNNTQTFLNGLM